MAKKVLIKYILNGQIPGSDDDTAVEISILGNESLVDKFIEKILCGRNIPSDWKSRPAISLENRYEECAHTKSVTELIDGAEEKTCLKESISKLASLPPHNPARFETVDGVEDPNCNNGMRAAFACVALNKFQQICKMTEDIDVASADLICDLLHLIHASGHQTISVLESAFDHFLAEAGDIEGSNLN